MPRYAEARRSTMMGVANAPKRWLHNDTEIFVPRFFALPDHPYPRLTASSVRRKAGWVENQLGDWRPDIILCHTLWPVAHLAERLATRWGVPWVGIVHGYDMDVGLRLKGVGANIRGALASCDALVCARTGWPPSLQAFPPRPSVWRPFLASPTFTRNGDGQ